MRRALRPALAVVAGCLLLAAGVGAGARPEASAVAAAAELHHAAVVVDTGTEVRKMCLAFPEESITGEEALRRANTDPVFASYSSKGVAVCSLCGVGCGDPSNCFCNPDRFWAYYRHAPGATAYSYSNVGASSTAVRDGDVEAWKWGKGEPPAFVKVSEVCPIDEPPPRASSSSSGATTTSTVAPGDAPAESSPAPATSAPGAAPAASPRPAGGTPSPTAPLAAPVAGAPPSAVIATPTSAEVTPPTDAAGGEVAAPSVGVDPPRPSPTPASVRRTGHHRGTGGGVSPVALAAFVAVLGGLLGWRRRARRGRAA